MGFLFAMTFPALVLALLAVVTVDRILVRRRGRGIGGSSTSSAGPSMGQVGFDQVAACFYAGKRVELEERQAQEQRVDESDSGDPQIPLSH